MTSTTNEDNLLKEGSPRITTQIDELEKETAQCKRQLNRIKASLGSKTVSDGERISLKQSLENMQNELTLKEKRLSYLHRENKKTTLFAILVFSLAIIVYVLLKGTETL